MHQDNTENNIDHRCRKDFELKKEKNDIDIFFDLYAVALVSNNRKDDEEKRKKKLIHFKNNVSKYFGY
jgi:hypothetical protein